MATDKRKKLVVIENGTLVSMANNAAYLKEFPFLAGIARRSQRKTGCGSCAQNKDIKTEFGVVKQALANLASDRKRRLKEMLGAKEARIVYTPSGTTKVVSLTF